MHKAGLLPCLLGYKLGDLRAIHVYEGGLHIHELNPERAPKSSRGAAIKECFGCEVMNDSRTAETREELEPMLFDFWISEVFYTLPWLDQFAWAGRYPEDFDHDQRIRMLQWNDPNGEYQDIDDEDESLELLNKTIKEKCIERMKNLTFKIIDNADNNSHNWLGFQKIKVLERVLFRQFTMTALPLV